MKKIKLHKKSKSRKNSPLKLVLLDKSPITSKKLSNSSKILNNSEIKNVRIAKQKTSKKTVTKIEKLENFKITNKKNLEYFKNFPNKEDSIICSFISNDINIIKI